MGNKEVEQLTMVVDRLAQRLSSLEEELHREVTALVAKVQAFEDMQPQTTVVPPEQKEAPKRNWDTPEWRAGPHYR